MYMYIDKGRELNLLECHYLHTSYAKSIVEWQGSKVVLNLV
jgi:hypothetical protein